MPYRLKEEARRWEPIAGVPWRDMSDAEFAEVSAWYDAQFPDQPGSLLRWFAPEPHEGAGGAAEEVTEHGDPD